MSGAEPSAVDEDLLRRADRVIVVGGAQLEAVDGMRAAIERWTVDESGDTAEERMAALRDSIDAHATRLAGEYGARPGA
ncbi:hypothetical protein [Corynebacterium sp. 335C]